MHRIILAFLWAPSFVYGQRVPTSGVKGEEASTGLFDFFTGIWNWVMALGFFVVGLFLALIITKIVINRMVKRSKYQFNEQALLLVERVVHLSIIMFFAIVAFNIGGADLTWVVGPLSVGLGFAFKDLLANFIGGFVILTQHKFKIGDVIKVGETLGKIKNIEARTTEVLAFDGTTLLVPNADMLTSVVQNYTANSFRRLAFEVGVHYKTNLSEAMNLIKEVLKSHDLILQEPVPKVLATEFGDSSITLEVRVWFESQNNWIELRSELIQGIKIAFDEAGIVIPFPIRTLTLDEFDKNLLKAIPGAVPHA